MVTRSLLDGTSAQVGAVVINANKLAFNRKEAAALLGISPPSLDRLVQRGLIRPSRALRTPKFTRAELERFLRETA